MGNNVTPRPGDAMLVRWARQDRVGVVTLNRPAKLNAITDELMTELVSVLDAVAADDETELVVLEGAGRAFCAGFDISTPPPAPSADRWPEEARLSGEAYWQAHFGLASEMLTKLWDLPQPVVAKVQGACLGGGMHLMLACDLAIASDDAFFGEPEVRFGGVPSFPILPLVVGLRRANDIWLAGERLSAARALEIGLVNRVAPASDLSNVVDAVAKQLTMVPKGTLRRVKGVSHQMGELLGARAALDIGRYAAVQALSRRDGEAAEFDQVVRSGGLNAGLAWLRSGFEAGGRASPEDG